MTVNEAFYEAEMINMSLRYKPGDPGVEKYIYNI